MLQELVPEQKIEAEDLRTGRFLRGVLVRWPKPLAFGNLVLSDLHPTRIFLGPYRMLIASVISSPRSYIGLSMSIPLLITGYASIYKCKRDEPGHYSQEKMQNSNHKLDDVPLFSLKQRWTFLSKIWAQKYGGPIATSDELPGEDAGFPVCYRDAGGGIADVLSFPCFFRPTFLVASLRGHDPPDFPGFHGIFHTNSR